MRGGARIRARRLRYLGRSVWCPICRLSASRFLPHRSRPDAACVHCGSLERHRLVWPRLRSNVARGAQLLLPIKHLSADLDSPLAMRHYDLTALPEPDASLDVVVCSHVLEHIPDDRQAMREIR